MGANVTQLVTEVLLKPLGSDVTARTTQAVAEVIYKPLGAEVPVRTTQAVAEVIFKLPGEPLHELDLVMDTKRPHWVWVGDILSLYRTALIWSDAKFKAITDRADLPTRYTFHAGNMAPGRTTAKIGGDPQRPNQAEAEFLSREADYARDIRYFENSASVYGAKDPIKPFNLSLIGITRPSEVQRASSILMKIRRRPLREFSWVSGLEGVDVEAGDVAAVGVPTMDFEAGYGGRILDGSLNHVLLDREVDIKSGYSYDLYIWHTQADTLELRSVGSQTGVTITVSPTLAFSYAVQPNDRWALGINSEDLTLSRVVKLRRVENGMHELTGEEFTRVAFDIVCPGSVTTPSSNPPPSQPSTASVAVVSGCVLCANIVTVPACIGGILPVPGTLSSVTLNSSHNPNLDALISDSAHFTTGPASGLVRTIIDWGGSATNVATISPTFTASQVPNSGDSYYVRYRDPPLGGVFVEVDIGSGFAGLGVIHGNSGCLNILHTANAMGVRLIPFSDRGIRNDTGPWTFSLASPGCADPDLITTVRTVTGSALTDFYTTNLPPDTLGTRNRVTVEAAGNVTEACSPANETTDLSLNLVYGTQILVQSLLINLNTVTSLAVVGSNRPALVTAEIFADGATGRQNAILRYSGQTNSGFADLVGLGRGTVDSTLVQTLGITAQFAHANSAGAVHAHNCHYLVFRNATLSVDSM